MVELAGDADVVGDVLRESRVVDRPDLGVAVAGSGVGGREEVDVRATDQRSRSLWYLVILSVAFLGANCAKKMNECVSSVPSARGARSTKIAHEG